MAKTQLPTNSDYQSAVNELKKLNEELFYEDFKTKINNLEINMERLSEDNTTLFKIETESIINRANSLFRQIEKHKDEMQELFETHKSTITQKNQELLENARGQLLFVYEELQNSIILFNQKNTDLQEDIESNNKHMIKYAIDTITSFSQNITEFTKKLAMTDQSNKDFSEQNKDFVSNITKQLNDTEQKLALSTETLQQMDKHWEQLLSSYEIKFHNQKENLKSDLMIREDTLVNKVTTLHSNWTIKQSENIESFNTEYLKNQEIITNLLNFQSKQTEDMLNSISSNMSTKVDALNFEKRSRIKMNVLLSVVVLQAILISIQYFI